MFKLMTYERIMIKYIFNILLIISVLDLKIKIIYKQLHYDSIFVN